MKTKKINPQPGPQYACMASSADVLVYGGAAGGGKTWALLLEALRHKNVRGFNCTIFRKNHTQIFAPGGLWDEASEMFQGISGASPRISSSTWLFRDASDRIVSKVKFAHLDGDADLPSWQGSQICLLCWDELTHFSEKQFFYMLSRNRSKCGVTPYVRATCNPDADSWVAKFIEWWIDPETGYAIPERSGVIRWFIRREEILHWADTKEELIEEFNLTTPEELQEPKSATFIASSVYDNQELLKVNPGYLSSLKAMPIIERERLLKGNWKIKASAGLFFTRSQLGAILPSVPDDVISWVRCWDLAATTSKENEGAAFTAGVLMGKRKNGRYVVADVINVRQSASDVRKLIKMTAQADRAKYKTVRIRLPQDPGQSGKDQAQSYIKYLAGFAVKAVQESGSKEARAEPMAAQWQAGNFDMVEGEWNEIYLNQLENFPDGRFKDMVDASANGFAELELKSAYDLHQLIY